MEGGKKGRYVCGRRKWQGLMVKAVHCNEGQGEGAPSLLEGRQTEGGVYGKERGRQRNSMGEEEQRD